MNGSLGGPLSGVRVLDLTRILAGPFATLMLADLGADVVKIEHPDTGDDTRLWGPPFLQSSDASTYFSSLNRGKRSVALDLSSGSNRQRLYEALPGFDVVVDNFRPGVADKLGVGPATLKAFNPELVTASIRGFPHGHSLEFQPGTEIIVEALSGLMQVTGSPDGPPTRFGIAMVDIATGLTTATRILAELFAARNGSQAEHVEVSLYQTATASLGTLITSYTSAGIEPGRWGSRHPTICPYGAFQCRDGYIVTGALNDRSWQVLCRVLGLEVLAANDELRTNSGRVRNRDAIESAIEERTRAHSRHGLLNELRVAGLLAAPVRHVGEAVREDLQSTPGMFVALEGADGAVSPRLDGRMSRATQVQSVPRLGEHTENALPSDIPRGQSYEEDY